MAEGQFEQYLAQANALVTQGKWDEALGIYEQLVQLNPQDVGLYQQIAQLSERKGDLPRAINAYMRWAYLCDARGQHDEALRLYGQILAMEGGADKKGPFKVAGNPDKIRELVAQYRPEISVQIGRILVQKGQADEAIRFLKGALDSPAGAQDARVHTLLGMAYMAKTMDKEAIGEFQEVVRLAPNEAAFAYEQLGHIFLRSGKPPQSTVVWFRNAGDLYLRNELMRDAIRAYEMILSFEPRNKEVLNKLAEIYLKQGLRDQALATYRNLAQIYTEEGLVDKVIILYEKLTEINPDDAETADKLLEIYRTILQRDPSNLSVRLKLIKHFENKGDTETAVPERLSLAAAYLEKGILDEANVQIQKVLELNPRDTHAREMLGDLLLKRDDKTAALEEYLQVLRLYREAGEEERCLAFSNKLMQVFPQETELYYQLAHSLKEQGALDESLLEIEKVLEQNPDHVPTMWDAGEIFMSQGRLEEARAMFARILEIEPGRMDARLQLLGYYLKVGELDGATDQVKHLVTTLSEKGLHRDAESLCRRLLAYYPDSAEIRLQICGLRLAQGDVESVLREYLLLANMFFKKQLLEKAAEMYGRILEQRPENLNAHYRLGRVMARQGQKPEALRHFGHLAEEYLKRNLFAQAMNVLGESVELDPDNIDLRQRLVDLLVRQLRIEEATLHYKHLIRTHMASGNLDEAGRRVKEVISLQPLHLDLRLELATMYLEYNHLEQGQGLLEELVSAYLQKRQTARVIDIYAKMAQVYRLQGRWDLFWQVRERAAELYHQEGRNDEAIAEYQEIIEGALRAGQFDRARAMFPGLGDLYQSEGRLSDGLTAFERMVEVFGRDGNVPEAMAAEDFLIQLLERGGEKQQALDLLQAMAERSMQAGDSALALATYGRMVDQLVALGDVDRAVATQFQRVEVQLGCRDLEGAHQVYGELRKLRGEGVADNRRFAELLYESEYFDEALPLFLETVESDPESVEARARLTVIHARRGEMGQAARMARGLLARGLLDRILDEFQRSKQFNEDEGKALLQLGAFYEEMGFSEEALLQYQRSGRLAQHRIEALNCMAFLFKRFGHQELAIRQFVRTLEQPGYDDEDLLETRYNLAQLYSEAGRYLEALSMFNECSAIKLRYRDVSERIEELTTLIASGAGTRMEPKAEVIPFSGREPEPTPAISASCEVVASAPEMPGAPAEAPPPHVSASHPEESASQPQTARHAEAPASLQDASPAPPPLELTAAATTPGDAQDAVPQADEAVPAAAAAPSSVEGASPTPEMLETPDDDFFLEGPPPDPAVG